MNNRFRNVVCVLVVLVGCGKKSSPDKAPEKPAEAPAAKPAVATPPAPSAKPDDPTASWTEQTGPGFKLKAPHGATEQHLTLTTAAGPVPATMWTGYESPGGESMWAVAADDFTTAKGNVDSMKLVNSAFDGLLGKLPGAKVDEVKEVTADGAVIGKELRASATLQGHDLRLHVLAMYRQKHLYVVQAVSGTDTKLADAFVDSFKLTN